MACTSVLRVAVAAVSISGQPHIPIEDQPQTERVRRPEGHRRRADGLGRRIDVAWA